MKALTTQINIRSTPEQIWRVLTDAPGYPTWDATYTHIEGRIAPGEKIVLHHASLEPKKLAMTVTVFEPYERLVWSGGGMPPAMFKGERMVTLAPQDDGLVAVSVALTFSGAMAPMIVQALPDLQPHLDRFAAALRQHCEALA